MISIKCPRHGWVSAIVLGTRKYCGHPDGCPTDHGTPWPDSEGGFGPYEVEVRIVPDDPAAVPPLVPGRPYSNDDMAAMRRRRYGEG